MKMIVAIIQPFKLGEVRESLMALGLGGMSVSEIKGFGRQRVQTEYYRGAEYVVGFLPKIKIELAVADDMLEHVITALQSSASTGRIGDGKIFVYDINRTVRIRTGETDSDAL
jgi:nitrogen regulatory protein PII